MAPLWSLALSVAEMMGILMRTRAALLSAVEELVSSGVLREELLPVLSALARRGAEGG